MKSHKRPLFKRPAWAKISEGEEGDIFRRSDRIYSHADQDFGDDIAQGEKVSHTPKASVSNERNLGDDAIEPAACQPDNEATYASSKGIEAKMYSPVNLRGGNTAEEFQKVRSASLVQGYNVATTKGANPTKRKLDCDPVDIVDLEEASNTSSTDPDDSRAITNVKSPHRHLDSKNDDDDLKDEEFPELARLARERARRKRLEQDAFQGSMNAADSSLRIASPIEQSTSGPTNHDPTVQILVTSDIEHSQPLIVTRRLSQRLKDVKLAWIQHQRPECGPLDHIFLTWRGKRVYDITSCQSLGFNKDETTGPSDIQQLARIHMVAMTRETFDRLRQIRDKKLESGEDEDEIVSPEPKAATEIEKQIRIILQSRDFSDFKLIVKQSTPISKIVNAFRNTKQIDANREIFLQFDGERLRVDDTVGDTELEDMDHLEVYH